MRPRKFAHSCFSSLVHSLLPKDNILSFGYCDFVAAVERLHALHYSVDFIFLSFGIMCFIV